MSSRDNLELPNSRFLINRPGAANEPVLVIFAGVHGNEPSGWIALERVRQKIEQQKINLKGSFYGVAGNLCAIQQQQRYCDEDLNRVFLKGKIQKVREEVEGLTAEERELREILRATDQIQQRTTHEIYFVDCHTTSAESIPYISLNEGYQESYHFAKGITATSVMGIEREIKGCLPEWFNQEGWHGFTFEAGQHQARSSVESQEAIIWQGLLHAECISQGQCSELLEWSQQTLHKNGANHETFYSVISSYRIRPDEEFKMEPGFVNLQRIHRGEVLATSNGKPVLSPANAHILMPLYQKQGTFGFFIAEEIDEKYLEFRESL